MFHSVNVDGNAGFPGHKADEGEEEASRHSENQHSVEALKRPHHRNHVVGNALDAVCMERNVFQPASLMLFKMPVKVERAAEHRIFHIVRPVAADDVVDEALEAAIFSRYALRAYDRDFFHWDKITYFSFIMQERGVFCRYCQPLRSLRGKASGK